MPRDYYDILNVGRSADNNAIKKAYRKLAKKYHPDIDKSTGASERFSEVQKAYDVLSDAKKRSMYDRYGHTAVNGSASGNGGAGFGGFGGGRQRGTESGGFDFNFTDADSGNVSDIFEQFFSGGGIRSGPGAKRSSWAQQQPTKGDDVEHGITVPFAMSVNGGVYSVKLRRGGKTESIDVKIPKGLADGAKLRVRDKGHPGKNGGQRGDLILRVKVGKHEYFRRDGLNLFIDVPVSIDEAVFGTTVELPTLNGKATLRIPAGTSGGKRLRLRGAGLTNTKGETGDLFAVVQINVPGELTDEQRELLEKLSGKLPDARRDVMW